MIRAALKSLLGRKVRLVMSTFAIVLGVAFVAGTLVFSDTLNRSFTALFASTVGDVVVRPTGAMAGPISSTLTVPDELVDETARVPGAARADGQVNAFGVYVVGRNGKALGGFGPPSLGGNWDTAPAGHGIEGLSIVSGRAPRGPGEVVLDERTAADAGYAVGDRVPIVTAFGTERLEPRLVGVAGFVDGGSLNGATLALFATPVAQRLFLDDDAAFSTIWVTAEDDVSQDELAERVARVLPPGFEAVTGDDAAEEAAGPLRQAIGFLTTFLLIFAGIALVVGAFLIVNTFSILVAQRSRELALLRALGASKRQVTRSVQLEALVLGIFGSTVGLGLGVLLAIAIRALFAQFGLDLRGQPLIFAPRTVVAAYAVGVVVTMAAAWLPARRTARIAPVQALRDDVALPESSLRRRFGLGVALAGAGLLALVVGLGDVVEVPHGGWCVGAGVLAILLGVSAASPVLSRPLLLLARSAYARTFGTVGVLAGQNSLRNPRRTTATASALMIGLALACTMAIVGDSAKASVDRSIEENFVGDYVVTSIFGGSFSSGLAARVADVDGVASVVRERYQQVNHDGGPRILAATGAQGIDQLELELTSGRPADFRNGRVLLKDSFADDEGLAVGDRIELDVPSGTVTWEVAGTFADNPVVFGSILTTLGSMTDAGYPVEDSLLVVTADAGAGDLQAGLDRALADQPIVTAQDQAAFAEEQRAPIDQFVLLIFALLGLALVIAVLGIVNTLALSVIERTREIGLLRAIGTGRGQVRLMITLESVVIAVLGAVLGLVLGVFFGIVLMYAVRDQGLEVISVPFGQLGIFLGLSVVIGVLAALFPARRAARLDVLRAIATE